MKKKLMFFNIFLFKNNLLVKMRKNRTGFCMQIIYTSNVPFIQLIF